MPNNARKMSRFRYLRAYSLTFKIIFRYLWLFILAKVFSEIRMQRIYYKAHIQSSQEIIKALQELKGLFIKIGQTLSVMSNFLPETFVKGLESLQDDVAAHDFSEIEERFQKDFGKSSNELFARIEREPIASASLAQVHVAHLKSGEKLAVKVQYPGIESLTHKDLKTLRRIFSLIDFLLPQYNLKIIYEECEEVILEELDFQKEAQNIDAIANHFKNQNEFIFPKVFQECSSQKVLALSFIEGVKVTQGEKLDEMGIDKQKLCRQILNFFCKQIFVDGIYHADPHPGNIIITPQGKIALIDFGAIASISQEMRQGMAVFVEGLIKKEADQLSQALRMMGFVSRKSDEETLDRVVEYFYSKISNIKIENFKKINITEFHDLNDLVELKKMDVSFRELSHLFVVPKEWILLERTLLILSGVSAELDEKHNPIETVIPYVEEFLLGKEKGFNDLVLQAGKDLILSYINLPHKLERLFKKIDSGKVEIQVLGLNENLKDLKKGVSLFTFSFLAFGCLWLSLESYTVGKLQMSEYLEYSSLGFSILFILRFFKKA
jgi:predicted unusual protein kinase regulating ubiquinone biosynthesis (AarF/ABC1/UbiB family)